MSFTGFPAETFEFLRDLADNNSKSWFDAHRADYDEFYVTPARNFVETIGPDLRKLSKTVNYAAKVNGSIFRIQRDTRFAKDKTPYKTHLDFWFWEGENRGWDAPGFFLRLTPSTMTAGAGMHNFAPPQLAQYRAAAIGEESGDALEKVLRKLGDLSLGGSTRRTVPRGFPASHPRARLLLHDGLYGFSEGPLPKSVHSAAFAGECLDRFRNGAPLNRWLIEFVAKKAVSR